MKRRLMNIATRICAFSLALTPFFQYKGSSVFFFGEPKYPEKTAFENEK